VKSIKRQLTFRIEVSCSSETSVEFQRATRRYVPEDRNQVLKVGRKTYANWSESNLDNIQGCVVG
jgi:hypothetical protein